LIKSIDERQVKIESIAKAAKEAKDSSLVAEERINRLLTKAKAEANEIVASAKTKSAAMLTAAEEKSRKRAEQIVADAQTQIDKDIVAAKKALREETVELVALATEKILGKTISDKIDNSLIADAIKDAK
jgi:F-type H+-transporting ATPase subunit b